METFSSSELPVLRSARLELRPLVASDAPAVFEYASLPEVSRWCTWDRHATLSDSEGFLHWNSTLDGVEQIPSWAIVDAGEGRLLGTGGWAWRDPGKGVGEIGYVLRPEVWGRGYATEFVALILEWGRSELGLHLAIARTMLPNAASMRVLEKTGFRRVRDEPGGFEKNGVPMDIVHWERDLGGD
ncbi:MAG: GNAT family N-acetyltransferase [Fibrobacteria bacterium]|nr:GNAT family N-acetyltransferase [Fibrobacteria bacterium]